MKRYRQPLSEEFFYSSPERLTGNSYRWVADTSIPSVSQLQIKKAVRCDAKKGGVSFSNRYFVRDLVLTLLAAVFTGFAGSILLILLVFGWGHAVADSRYPFPVDLQQRLLDSQQLGRVPMLKGDVPIDNTGVLAKVRVAHLLVNPSQSWVERVYQFPLPGRPPG
jgi:hypothetical protein